MGLYLELSLGRPRFGVRLPLRNPRKWPRTLRRRIPTRSPCGSRVTEFVDLTGDRAASSPKVGMGLCDAQGGSYRLSGTPFVAPVVPDNAFCHCPSIDVALPLEEPHDKSRQWR